LPRRSIGVWPTSCVMSSAMREEVEGLSTAMARLV